MTSHAEHPPIDSDDAQPPDHPPVSGWILLAIHVPEGCELEDALQNGVENLCDVEPDEIPHLWDESDLPPRGLIRLGEQ